MILLVKAQKLAIFFKLWLDNCNVIAIPIQALRL